MCANFHIEITDPRMMEIMKAAMKAPNVLDDDFSMLIKNKGEVFPTDAVPVQSGPETFRPMTWGFPRMGTTDVTYNARSEGVLDEKSMFRDSMVRRRCVVPAAGYYETWKKRGQEVKYYFRLPGGGMMYLAGCWREERGARLPVFTILTRDAVGELGDIHNRMPVLIAPERVDEWLVEGMAPMKQPVMDLVFEAVYPEESLFNQNW